MPCNCPQTGLVLDIRGNPGGSIGAGEFLLQTLTPNAITPEDFHFLNSPFTGRICRENPAGDDLPRWCPSIAWSKKTGERLSAGFPLESSCEAYNRVGQQYYGPVVLLFNGLSYSTSDIFAAGFQDHDIGPILGTSGNVGAGGANGWSYDELRCYNPGFRLPRSFQLDLDAGRIPDALRDRLARRTLPVAGRRRVPPAHLRLRWNGLGYLRPGIGGLRRGNLIRLAQRQNQRLLAGDESPVQPLPKGVDLSFAARQSSRVGMQWGMPVEERGLAPALSVHLTTRADLICRTSTC